MSNWFAQLVSAPGLAGSEAELNWFRQLVSASPPHSQNSPLAAWPDFEKQYFETYFRGGMASIRCFLPVFLL